MEKLKKQNAGRLALFAGTTALVALANQSHAQSSDALIDKLVEKGVLTVQEAQDLRNEADQDFTTAFQAKTGMPDWVTGYKFSGSFRGRFEEFTSENPSFVERTRLRYRLLVGVVVSMKDGLETGFQLGSGDGSPNSFGSGSAGNPLSNNSTFQDDFTKKPIWVNTAYGKWTPLNSDGWLLSTTIGKMENPFQFTPMVFDPDLTPEGAALQGGYTFNDQHSVLLTAAAFVLDEEKLAGQDPALFGGQMVWNANWTQRLNTSLGLGGFVITSPLQLTPANVPYVNEGNTRILTPNVTTNTLVNNYMPIIVDASATYKLDTFPFYTGAFPIKVAGEYIFNTGLIAKNNPPNYSQNQGIWGGITFGKSGTKGTWDISYRYEYLEADAWYDQLVDDDNVAYYQNSLNGSPGGTGMFGGTNVKGHLIKANYSITDALTFTFTCYLNQLIYPNQNTAANSGGEPQSNALHVMADLMWKF
jgi:hypothetical protein